MDSSLSIFIASASEGLEVANVLRDALQSNEGFEPRVWNEGTFKPSMTFIEALEAELDQSDFAILTLTPDDQIMSRGRSSMVPRDNVLFELGLFMGRLGRERTYFVFDKSQNPKVPTDLLGVTAASYEKSEGKTVSDSLATACTAIAARMRELGIREKCSQAGKVEIHTITQFCDRIAGIWWQEVRSEDEVKLSLFRVTADKEMRTVEMEGDSFAQEGELIAHWRSVAVGIRASDRTLFYSWEGEHPTTAAGKGFKGFGQFTFRQSADLYGHGDGLFADVQIGKKSVIWKSVEIHRVDPEDFDRIDRVMRDGDYNEKASAVKEMFDRVDVGLTASGSRH